MFLEMSHHSLPLPPPLSPLFSLSFTHTPPAIVCLPTLVDDQYQEQLLAPGGVGLGEGLWVVSLVGRALKGIHQVIGVDDRDVLVVVEGTVEALGK